MAIVGPHHLPKIVGQKVKTNHQSDSKWAINYLNSVNFIQNVNNLEKLQDFILLSPNPLSSSSIRSRCLDVKPVFHSRMRFSLLPTPQRTWSAYEAWTTGRCLPTSPRTLTIWKSKFRIKNRKMLNEWQTWVKNEFTRSADRGKNWTAGQ